MQHRTSFAKRVSFSPNHINNEQSAASTAQHEPQVLTSQTDQLDAHVSQPVTNSLPLLGDLFCHFSFVSGHLSQKFKNLTGKVIFFRPYVWRKTSSGSYTERVIFVLPDGEVHICDNEANPKRKIHLSKVNSVATQNQTIVLLVEENELSEHDAQLRFDSCAEEPKLSSLQEFIQIIRHFNPQVSVLQGSLSSMKLLHKSLKKPITFFPPGEVSALSSSPNSDALESSLPTIGVEDKQRNTVAEEGPDTQPKRIFSSNNAASLHVSSTVRLKKSKSTPMAQQVEPSCCSLNVTASNGKVAADLHASKHLDALSQTFSLKFGEDVSAWESQQESKGLTTSESVEVFSPTLGKQIVFNLSETPTYVEPQCLLPSARSESQRFPQLEKDIELLKDLHEELWKDNVELESQIREAEKQIVALEELCCASVLNNSTALSSTTRLIPTKSYQQVSALSLLVLKICRRNLQLSLKSKWEESSRVVQEFC